MKLGKGVYDNFGSYSHLEFDYNLHGVGVVTGDTGSGKSTLLDAAFWCLFGETSKGGTVDEVKSWTATEATQGVQEIETSDGTQIRVTRRRSSGKGGNDLYWTVGAERPSRGKDLSDTQKLLNARLGFDSELFLLSAYFSQFSTSENFFKARAKDRRDLLEKLVDLSLPIKIAEKASEERKESKRRLDEANTEYARLSGKLDALRTNTGNSERDYRDWESGRSEKLVVLRRSARTSQETNRKRLETTLIRLDSVRLSHVEASTLENQKREVEARKEALGKVQKDYFELEKELVELKTEIKGVSAEINKTRSLPLTCPTCYGPTATMHCGNRLEQLEDEFRFKNNALDIGIEDQATFNDILAADTLVLNTCESALASMESDYAECSRQIQDLERQLKELESQDNTAEKELKALEAETNPHKTRRKRDREEQDKAEKGIEAGQAMIKALETSYSDLSQVYDLSFELRGQMLNKAVLELQIATNSYLQNHFEGEISVEFSLDSDKLEVDIHKNSHKCSFTQLSGGQRRMLTVCFAISVMHAAANKAGIHFDNLFLDEPFNGFDITLKLSAYGLLEELSKHHSSILVIEHSEEFKTMFDKQYRVTLVGDCSEIEEVA